MPDPPEDYNICPCCGTEFGSDDEVRTHVQLREFWMASGAKWFFRDAPPFWNPWMQLISAGAPVPYIPTQRGLLLGNALRVANRLKTRSKTTRTFSYGQEVSDLPLAKAA